MSKLSKEDIEALITVMGEEEALKYLKSIGEALEKEPIQHSADYVWGASEEEWDFVLSFVPHKDIIPIVSDATVKVSQGSTLRKVGKVPSVVDRHGFAVGLPAWADKVTTEEEIDQWRKDSRLGIACIGRTIHAIDIDIEDKYLSDLVVSVVDDFCTANGLQKMYKRYRQGTGKALLMYKADGRRYVRKKVIKLYDSKGVVEFLFHRQQFLLCGTHPSGSRYEIDTEDRGIPTLTEDQLINIGTAITTVLHANAACANEAFYLQDAAKAETASDEEVKRRIAEDPDAIAIMNSHLYKGVIRNGGLVITCPMEHLHAVKGDYDTLYYPKNGMGTGTVHCFHTTHGKVTAQDVFNAIGHTSRVVENEAEKAVEVLAKQSNEVIQPAPLAEEKVDLFNRFTRNAKGGITKSEQNLYLALRNGRLLGLPEFRFDTFQNKAFIRRTAKGQWGSLTDEDFPRIRRILNYAMFGGDRGFSAPDVREYVTEVIHENSYDTGVKIAQTIGEWDGMDYIGRIAKVITHPEYDVEYAKAVFVYLFTAIYGRTCTNIGAGVKADIVPVLVGKEGVGKSTLCKSLCLHPDLFTDSFSFKNNEADMIRLTLGKSVVEIAELEGLHKVSGTSVKQFITRTDDEWTPKYSNHVRRAVRRFIFIGTTNDELFISDAIGSRRWAPIKVRDTLIDLDDIKANIYGAYTQAKYLYENSGGVQYSALASKQSEYNKDFALDTPALHTLKEHVLSTIRACEYDFIEITYKELLNDVFNVATSTSTTLASIIRGYMSSIGKYNKLTNSWVIDTEEFLKQVGLSKHVETQDTFDRILNDLDI